MSDLVPVTEALPEPTPTTVFDWLDASVPVVWAMERRTAEGRQRVGQALWLLRGLLADGAYGEQVRALATTHDVDERTLRRWRAEAEEALALPPHPATTAKVRKQLPQTTGADTVSAKPDAASDRGEPQTRDAWTERVNSIRNADLAYLRKVDKAVLRAARKRIDEALATDTTATEAGKAVKPDGCKHPEWRLIGVTGYRCAVCDTHLGQARPSHGRKVA